MAADLSPFLILNGTARDALIFYADVLGSDAPVIRTYGDYQASDDPQDHNRVVYGVVHNPHGFIIRAADAPATQPVAASTNHALCINGDDAELIRHYWDKLAVTGTITKPLTAAAWGDTYGELTDQFGVNWKINIGQSE